MGDSEGTRLQLAARAPQDRWLWRRRGPNPFLAPAWKRHTPFAVQTVPVDIAWTPGKRSSAQVPRSGDVLGDVTLEVLLPAVPQAPPGARWVASVGYAMLRRARLIVDDAEVHTFERLWYDIYDGLYAEAGHAKGLADMVGRARLSMHVPHVLYVPLRFMTSRKGAARPVLPLRAMAEASRLLVDIEFEAAAALAPDVVPGAGVIPGIRTTLLCDVVHLDDSESRAMLSRDHVIPFETVMDVDGLSYRIDDGGVVRDDSTVSVDLGSRVKFAAKFVAWVAYLESPGTPMFTYLPDPLTDAAVLFDGQRRFEPRRSAYFSLVQKYSHFRRASPGPPDAYSFALNATSRKPSGAADLAALHSSVLRGEVSPHLRGVRFKLKAFVVYHNSLEIRAGAARLAFL